MDYISRDRVIKRSEVLSYESSGLSNRQIAKKLGISGMGYWKICRKMGWRRSKRGNRIDKGVERKSREHKLAVRKAASMRYQAKFKNGNHYLRLRVNGISTSMSRFVASLVFGRDLTKDECVHHEDENVKNNHPYNLFLFETHRDHLAYHKGKTDMTYIQLKDIYEKYKFGQKVEFAGISRRSKDYLLKFTKVSLLSMLNTGIKG